MGGINLADCHHKYQSSHPSKFSIFPSLFLFVPSSCQESCFSPFAFIFYPQNCHHTAAAFPSPSSLPPHRFLAPFLLPRLPLETHQTGVAGDEADGEDDRRNFSGGRNERRCGEEPHKHYPPPPQTLYLLDHQLACEMQPCQSIDTHTHSQCICPP